MIVTPNGTVTDLVALFPAESLTPTVNVAADAPVGGAPLNVPEADRVNHAGNPVADHVYPLPLPPVAVSV